MDETPIIPIVINSCLRKQPFLPLTKCSIPFNEYRSRLIPGFLQYLGCEAHIANRPAVAANGKIFSCVYLVNNHKYEVGDLNKNDFPRKKTLQSMAKSIHIDQRKKCQQCHYRYLCGGGCPLGLFSMADNSNIPNYIKQYTQNITCAGIMTVLTELLWDMCRKVDENLEF